MVDYIATGPLFDGRATQALIDYKHDLTVKLGNIAEQRVRMDLDLVLKHQTGYYRSAIHVEGGDDMGGESIRVTDTPVVYGPWLEGVGSRNSPVTRFRGYHTFRKVFQQLNREAKGIAIDILVSGGYLRRMNE